MRNRLRFLAFTIAPIGFLSGDDCRGDDVSFPAVRPFRMGFTRWPADLTVEGVQIA